MFESKVLSEDLRMALETIRSHKVRSFLTVLGVVIGVSVAIVVTSVLLGFQDNVQKSLNEFGVNNIWVFRFNLGIHFGRLSMEERMRKPLTYDDGMAIKEECSAIKDVSLSIFPRQPNVPHPIPTAPTKRNAPPTTH